MKVTAILKGNPDPEGRYTVYIRTNEGERRTFQATSLKVTKAQFNKGVVVDHPKAKEYNQQLKTKLAQAQLAQSYRTPDEANVHLYSYALQCIEDWQAIKRIKSPTARQYRSEAEKLLSFRDAKLKDINSTYFTDLLKWMYKPHLDKRGRTVAANKQSTAWRTFKFLHSVLEYAAKNDLLLKNPLDKYSDNPKYRSPDKNYLTNEQIRDLLKFAKHGATPAQRFVTVWFLVGCYTGLSFGDLKDLDFKKHIKGGRIQKKRVKTNQDIDIPLLPMTKELFEMNGYKRLTHSNQKYNTMLKTVADKTGLPVNLTSHIARHTAAVKLADAGVSIEVTADILGHKGTQHTKVYYKITNKRKDEEYAKINK